MMMIYRKPSGYYFQILIVKDKFRFAEILKPDFSKQYSIIFTNCFGLNGSSKTYSSAKQKAKRTMKRYYPEAKRIWDVQKFCREEKLFWKRHSEQIN
jgi:hypothetical protein